MQPRWWNNAGMMLEQCMNDVPAAFQQHPSRAILPAASFQRHRSSIVSASFQHIRCSIVQASFQHCSQHHSSILQHHSSIIPASFEHRFSQHRSSIVPALFKQFSSIVPASVQHCLHLALWPSATRQQHLVVSSVGSSHHMSLLTPSLEHAYTKSCTWFSLPWLKSQEVTLSR